jgi:hypothetical protein
MSEDNPYVGYECPSPEVLSGFVSGSLPAALLTSVADHLATCGVCPNHRLNLAAARRGENRCVPT